MFKPIYNQVAGQMKDDIQSKRWEEKLPGVGALARHYAAAPKTISKAINVLANQGLVTTHGTRGTFITQTQSKRKRFGTIGVVGMYPQMHSTPTAAKAEEVAANLGYQLLFLGVPEGLGQATAHLHLMPVDGLVFINSTLNEKIVVQLRSENMPFVSANRFDEIPGLSWVEFDNEQGLKLALEYLSGLGHKRIAFVAFEVVLSAHQKWLEDIYQKFMIETGSYDPALWLSEISLSEYSNQLGWGDAHKEYGRDMGQKLLGMSNPPTAIYTGDQKIALGVQEVFQDACNTTGRDLTIFTKTRSAQESEQTKFAHIAADGVARMQRTIEILVHSTVRPINTPIHEFIPFKLIEPPLTVETQVDDLVLATV